MKFNIIGCLIINKIVPTTIIYKLNNNNNLILCCWYSGVYRYKSNYNKNYIIHSPAEKQQTIQQTGSSDIVESGVQYVQLPPPA